MKNYHENGPYNIYAETETTVEFYHCDLMNIVWNGNYFNFLKQTDVHYWKSSSIHTMT